MGTSGHIVIRGRGERSHHLYTSHDGHTRDAVRDLVALPFLLHDKAVRYAERILDRDKDKDFPDMRFHGGPFHLWVMRDIGRYSSFEEVRGMFRAALPVELDCSTLAHWVCGMYNSRWHVIWRKSQLYYQEKPRVRVTIDGGDYAVYGGSESDRRAATSGIADRQKDFPVPDRVLDDAEDKCVHVPFTGILMRLAHQYIREKADGQKKEAADQ